MTRPERKVLRAIGEVVPDLLSLIDRAGTIAYASPAAKRVIGYRPEEMTGNPFDRFVHPEDVAYARDCFDALVTDRHPVGTSVRLCRKDGSSVALEVSARECLEVPGLQGIVVLSRVRGIAESQGLARLSRRERQVLSAVAEGLTSRQIAAQLGVTSGTVDTYRSRLMAKLDVDNVTALVRMAIREGFVQP